MWHASMERWFVAPAGSSTVLNGSGVDKCCPQNIACCCIVQYCLLLWYDQTTVAKMHCLSERWKMEHCLFGTVCGWTQDKIKNLFNCSQSTVSWLLSSIWTTDHIMDTSVWLTNWMMHLWWDKHRILHSSLPPKSKLIAPNHYNVCLQTIHNCLQSANLKTYRY